MVFRMSQDTQHFRGGHDLPPNKEQPRLHINPKIKATISAMISTTNSSIFTTIFAWWYYN